MHIRVSIYLLLPYNSRTTVGVDRRTWRAGQIVGVTKRVAF